MCRRPGDGTKLGGNSTNCSKDKFRPHGDGTTGKITNVVVVEIRISGNAESAGLSSYASDRFRALIEQIKDLGTDLKIESSVVAEPRVLQENRVCLVEATCPECVPSGGRACKKSRADVTGIRI
jgi:hypothetical protein